MSTTADIVFENVAAPGNWGDLADGPKKDIRPAASAAKPAKADPKKDAKATPVEELMEDSTTLAKGGLVKAPKAKHTGSKKSSAATPAAVPNFGKGSGKTVTDVFKTFGLQVEDIAIHKMLRDITEQELRISAQSSIHAYVCGLTAKQLETLADAKEQTHWVPIARLERVAQNPKVKALMDSADIEGCATLPLRVAYIEAMLKGIECLTGTSFPMARTLKCSHHIKALGLSEPKMFTPNVSEGKLMHPVNITAEKAKHIRTTNVAEMLKNQQEINEGIAVLTTAKHTKMLLLLVQLRLHRKAASEAAITPDQLEEAEKLYQTEQSRLHKATASGKDYEVKLVALQTKLTELVQVAKDFEQELLDEGHSQEKVTDVVAYYLINDRCQEILELCDLPLIPGADLHNAAVIGDLKMRLAFSLMACTGIKVLTYTPGGLMVPVDAPDFGFGKGVLDVSDPSDAALASYTHQLSLVKQRLALEGELVSFLSN